MMMEQKNVLYEMVSSICLFLLLIFLLCSADPWTRTDRGPKTGPDRTGPDRTGLEHLGPDEFRKTDP